MVREIPLSQGKIALVDDEDFDRVNQFKWCAAATSSSRTWYAMRGDYTGSKPRTIYLHRFILDAPSDMDVDHINHNGLDCRRENMRLATTSQNCCNRRKNVGSKFRFKGIQARRNRFAVRVPFDGRLVHFRTYATQEEAARIYDAVVARLRGEFAHTNFPDIDPDADAIAARLIAEKGLAA